MYRLEYQNNRGEWARLAPRYELSKALHMANVLAVRLQKVLRVVDADGRVISTTEDLS